MAILTIVKHPAEVLEKECEPVKQFDKNLKTLLNNMYDTMLAADGVGLAAPQVGIDQQIAVVDIGDEAGRINLINPVILETKGEQTDIEGCLSFPGFIRNSFTSLLRKSKSTRYKGKNVLFRSRRLSCTCHSA